MPTLDDFLSHPIETLERALHIRKQIAALQEALREVFGESASVAPAVTASPGETQRRRGHGKGKRTMSPEARAKIVAAQKARWAKIKGAKVESPVAASIPTSRCAHARRLSL